MYVVFYNTSDVFEAEEILKSMNIECSIVPTPVSDKAYCGVCLQLNAGSGLQSISTIEYERIEG